jgi:hypothetical protein
MSVSISATNRAAALSLANAGFRVFPARAIYNSATQRWNKPPLLRDWQSVATNDPSRIDSWWKEFPDAIPAVCCEDFLVIDADRHPGAPDGVAALAALVRKNGDWPEHPFVLTPANGEHHYFGQTNPPLGNRTGQLPDGIDVRSVGGYVIGVGAVLGDGTRWRLARGHCTDLPNLPQWLEQLVRANESHQINHTVIASQSSVTRREECYAEAALERGINEIATAPNGKRNTILNNVAYRIGRMVARDWIDRDKVENCLLFAASELTKEDGVTAVLATIKSGLGAGCRRPHPDLPEREG